MGASSQRARPARYFPLAASEYAMPGDFEALRPRPDRNGAADGHHFQIDERLADYRARKAQLLADPRDARRHHLSLPRWDAQLARVHRWMAATVQREHPGHFGQPPPTLDALAAQLQEDVVVMARAAGCDAASAIAIYVNVCFPSGWRPWQILGADFERIHAPVPSHDQFTTGGATHGDTGRGRRALAATLFGDTRVRYVWTVVPNDELSRLPDSDRLGDWTSTDSGYLRVERQVVAPLPHDATDDHCSDLSVFAIRIHHYAFDTLSTQQRRTLAAAVLAMPDTVARYKGLHDHRAAITARLR